MNIKKLNEKCKKLSALLDDDPHPELVSWNVIVTNLAEELVRLITSVGHNYYFCYVPPDAPDDEYPNTYFIVHKEFWDKHKSLDDDCIAGDLNLPDCFNEVEESMFECDDPDGKAMLLDMGFIEKNLQLL